MRYRMSVSSPPTQIVRLGDKPHVFRNLQKRVVEAKNDLNLHIHFSLLFYSEFFSIFYNKNTKRIIFEVNFTFYANFKKEMKKIEIKMIV